MGETLDARDLGRVEAKLEAHEKLLQEVREDMKAMRAAWDQAQGGWKVLIGVAAVLGSGVTYAIQWAISHMKFIS